MTIQDQINSLQSAFNKSKSETSDPNNVNYGGAVKNLQNAGNDAATLLGPAIDQLSGGSPDTTTLTHRAWTNNGLLNALNSGDDSTQDDLSQAQSFVQQMLVDYNSAARVAQKSPNPKPPPAPIPSYSAPKPIAPPVQTPLAGTPPVSYSKPKNPQLYEFGGTAIGATAGFMIAGPIGAAIGGAVGFGIGKILG